MLNASKQAVGKYLKNMPRLIPISYQFILHNHPVTYSIDKASLYKSSSFSFFMPFSGVGISFYLWIP
jgi:hypothetical protein